MIQLSDDGKAHARTWHWLKGGVLQKRTIIKEHKVESPP
jgi:hypothetical protein